MSSQETKQCIRQRKWRNEHRTEHRKQVKDWKQANREKVREQKKRYYAKNREKIASKRKELRERKKQFIAKIYGDCCFLCEEKEKRIEYHEIHGNKHESSLLTYGFEQIQECKDDFVPLCNRCHKMIHGMMELFGFTWEEILDRIKKMN